MNFRTFFSREFAHSRAQLLMYILCVALSLISVVSLGAFDASVQSSLSRDAKALNGGDIVVHASQPLSDAISKRIEEVGTQEGNSVATIVHFPTVVVSPQQDTSLLSHIKAVDQQYPLYGEVVLASGNSLHETLQSGSIVVESNVLERLGVHVGEKISIGEGTFLIADVIKDIPDESVNIFTSGQTVIMRMDDTEQTKLIGARSRISYHQYVQLSDPDQIDALVSELEAISAPRERIDSFKNARTSTDRFLEEFLFFLNLISLFTMLLAGIGMMSTLSAYLRGRQQTVAILKTLGMKNKEVMSLFLRFILVLSSIGILLGMSFGLLTLSFLPALFGEFLPKDFTPELQLLPLLEALVLGLFVSIVFTALPLLKLKDTKPVQVFRQMEMESGKRGFWFYFLAGILFFLFGGFILLEIGEVRLGLYFLFGSIGLFALIWLICTFLLWGFGKLLKYCKPLYLRLAGKGLLRPGTSADLIMTALATALTILLTISLLEKNILHQFVNAYPEDYPNVFLIDIQRDQRVDLENTVGSKINFFPVIRATLIQHNDRVINEQTQKELGRQNDVVTRSFNLTYGGDLSQNETIVKTKEPRKILLSDYNREGFAQVSILDEFADILGIKISDEVTFLIQGVELKAEIVSIRHRKEDRVEPYFYFIFEEKVLADFPQTLFTTLKVNPDEIPALQNKVTKAFPNITTIDMTLIIGKTTSLLEKLNVIIRFFTFLSLIAGILLLISSLLATSVERIRETVYYKLLGFERFAVIRVVLYEFVFLGFFSAILGIFFAEISVWILTAQVLSIEFTVFAKNVMQFAILLVLLVVCIASVFLLPLLKKRPVDYLRENAEN